MRPLFILLLFCLPVAAQEVRIVESLPNDQFIVSISGKEYRALNADKVAELAKQKIDLEAAQKINAEQVIQIRELTLERDLAIEREARQKDKAASFEADFNRAREDAARNFSLFTSERDLRGEAQQYVPRGRATGKLARFLDFLNSQPAQLTIKWIVPVVNTLRCQQ